MADRDNDYRGYGQPSGRYYEAREYERGGGRSRETRGDGNWLGGSDRNRERSSSGDRDDWRDRNRGGNDDRGFLERAGEQVRSWFGDDDDDDRRERGGSRDQRDDWQDRARSQGQQRDRSYGWGSMMSGQGGRGNHDRDDRPPQTSRAEPTSGGYDHRREEWRGATSDRGMGSSRNQFAGGGRHPHDDHYQEWRQQQMSELDRDYEEYRREHRDKFHSEFSNWRGQRQQQRQSMRQVREHMEVIGSDGQPVGTVDKVSGDRIILTKNGPMAGGHHHSIPSSWIQAVDERVTINKSAEQARQQWTDEENRRALFESDNHGRDDGPHILDRSFSGTYEGPR